MGFQAAHNGTATARRQNNNLVHIPLNVYPFQAALPLAKSPISAIMRDFIGGSPRMAILSNGSGAEASSPLKKASAGGQARHPIHTILFPRETGFF